MKTELSRRTLLQIPLLAAVSAVPSISVGSEVVTAEWKRLLGFRTRMPTSYLATSDGNFELKPWKMWHVVYYRNGEYDRDHDAQLQHLEWYWKSQFGEFQKPDLHYSWPARNTDKSDPLAQHGLYVMSRGYSQKEFQQIIEQELMTPIPPNDEARYFMHAQSPFMPFPTRT